MKELSPHMHEAANRVQDAMAEIDCSHKLTVLAIAAGTIIHHLLIDHLPKGIAYGSALREIYAVFATEMEQVRAHVQEVDTREEPESIH